MATIDTPAYKRLGTLARRLGGQILHDRNWTGLWNEGQPNNGKRGYSEAPFDNGIGVYYAKKLIVHGNAGFTLSGLIHEMGHVFACRFQPNSRHCDETDFLGWEIALARRLSVTHIWMNEMGNYGVHVADDGTLDDEGDFSEIRGLTDKQRRKCFASAIVKAQRLGILGRRGEIRSIRN
jgi:hypothetical protein